MANIKTLKAELQQRGYSDNGLVGWGQNNNFGAIGALAARMHLISQMGNKIVITPFTGKEILFDKALGFDKSIIKKAKVGGFLIYSALKITTNDGTTYKYSLYQGKSDVKQIVSNLGL